jgi:uncharacterized PurR-regulated membrane protein YhhQ (DUF165 family)
VNVRILGAATAGAAYVGLVAGANLLTSRYPDVPVGPGLTATAGVFAAGATLTVRDLVQRLLAGPDPDQWHRLFARWCTWWLVIIGALLSAAYGSGRIAVASGVAFGIAEFLDLGVYSRLEQRGWTVAVWVPAAVAAPVDTALFLWLSRLPAGPADVAGQLVGKAWATLVVWAAVAAVLAYAARRRERREVRCSTS